MAARLIAIEGLDGSGKETQTNLLCEDLTVRGYKVASVSFPSYGKPSAAPVEQYLSGGYGRKAFDVNAYAASAFFAVDRLASYLGEWKVKYESNDVVIADRYTTSNAIHQLSKLPKSEWKQFVWWLFGFEFGKLALPEPNTVVYLQLDLAMSQKLLEERYGGDGSKRDVHERDMDYLERSRQAAEWCAEQFNWVTVNCMRGGNLRDRGDIHAEIMERLGF